MHPLNCNAQTAVPRQGNSNCTGPSRRRDSLRKRRTRTCDGAALYPERTGAGAVSWRPLEEGRPRTEVGRQVRQQESAAGGRSGAEIARQDCAADRRRRARLADPYSGRWHNDRPRAWPGRGQRARNGDRRHGARIRPTSRRPAASSGSRQPRWPMPRPRSDRRRSCPVRRRPSRSHALSSPTRRAVSCPASILPCYGRSRIRACGGRSGGAAGSSGKWWRRGNALVLEST